jgi:pimeloyl-ACP methyl ester carboxylesterase
MLCLSETPQSRPAAWCWRRYHAQGLDALSGAVTEAAWKAEPSHYLVAYEDKMIPPPALRAMAQRAKAQVKEVAGSHAIYVSRPGEVAEFIRRAADAAA